MMGVSGATLWSRTPIFHLPFLPLAVAFAFGSCFTAFGGGVWGHSAFSSSFCFFLCMDLMWLTNGLKSKPACLIDKLHQSHFGGQGPLSDWESCWARVAMLSAMAHLRRDSSRTCQGYTFIPTFSKKMLCEKSRLKFRYKLFPSQCPKHLSIFGTYMAIWSISQLFFVGPPGPL